MHRRPLPSNRAFIAGLGLVLGAFVWTACTDQADELPTGPSPEAAADAASPGDQDFGPAIAAADRHTPGLMQVPGVVGTGVGLDERGKPAVKIFLSHEDVPGLPERLDDVPVALEVTGLFWARVDRTERARPAPIGFSVGHPDVTAGTLGARVTDGNSVFILSNNHVIANSNDADIGDPTLQPGAFDGGSEPDDVIGYLADYEEISFNGEDNVMDAAISEVDPADVSGSTPDGEGYGAPGTSPLEAEVGMDVQKYGRTTGHTEGTVEEINVTVTVCFDGFGPFCTQSATFVDQFSITPGDFSDGGDSGSLIVRDGGDNDPMGLLFAGSSTRTIANPIGPVLDRFGVSIDPTVPDDDDPEPDPEDEGTLTGTVSDAETGGGIGGATVTVEGTGFSVTTTSGGGYTIEEIPEGSYDVTASADGYEPETRPAEITGGETTTLDFALQPEDDDPEPDPEGTVTVADVSYSFHGGPNSDRHLRVTVTLEDDEGAPVAGASVSADLTNVTTGQSWSFSDTTESDGAVTFGQNNAPDGCYELEVTDVDADGLDWDGETPANEACK